MMELIGIRLISIMVVCLVLIDEIGTAIMAEGRGRIPRRCRTVCRRKRLGLAITLLLLLQATLSCHIDGRKRRRRPSYRGQGVAH
jgi:hypothetical protein